MGAFPRGGLNTVVCLWVAAVCVVCFVPAWSIPDEYVAQRKALLSQEQAMRTGGLGSDLTSSERFVDTILREEKKKLIDEVRFDAKTYAARYSFLNLTSRAAMERTKSYKIIRKMPKGGVLHVHDEALASSHWLVKNVTYRPNCYMCVDSEFNVKFHFFQTPPPNPGCKWRRLADFRAEAGDVEAFDQSLYYNLTMETEDPAAAYPDVGAAWHWFQGLFFKVEGLMLYRPVFTDYLWQGLLEFRQDNVQYLEIRGLLPPVYELNGTIYDPRSVLKMYQDVINKFVKQYPDFTGLRFIKTALRFQNASLILDDLKLTVSLRRENPDFVVGFDLVGQEGPLHPLLYYLDDLLYPASLQPPVNLPYFFHAAETSWQETAVDYNLVDALLLNASRVGHGYALHKHPLIKQKMKERDIPVEVNPISNQVLKLVDDPRNHPAACLIAENYPVVISSDDPTLWGSTPLSHDFYVTFMALTGQEAGLATLKQLAKNSLRYSALSKTDKERALSLWQSKWDKFINNTVHDFINGKQCDCNK